jgi:hypothetical protein
LIAVAEAISGRDVPARMQALAQQWTSLIEVKAVVHLNKGSIADLRRLVEKARKGVDVVVIESAWDMKLARWLASHSAISTGRVLPIWIVPANYSLAIEFPPETHVVRAGPWGEAMLRHWLREEGLNGLDIRDMREKILAVTGGAPERLFAIRPFLQDSSPETQKRLLEWNQQHPLRPKDVGLPPELEASFVDFSAYGEVETRQDRAMFDERLPAALLALGLAEPVGLDGLRLSALGRLMKV